MQHSRVVLSLAKVLKRNAPKSVVKVLLNHRPAKQQPCQSFRALCEWTMKTGNCDLLPSEKHTPIEHLFRSLSGYNCLNISKTIETAIDMGKQHPEWITPYCKKRFTKLKQKLKTSTTTNRKRKLVKKNIPEEEELHEPAPSESIWFPRKYELRPNKGVPNYCEQSESDSDKIQEDYHYELSDSNGGSENDHKKRTKNKPKPTLKRKSSSTDYEIVKSELEQNVDMFSSLELRKAIKAVCPLKVIEIFLKYKPAHLQSHTAFRELCKFAMRTGQTHIIEFKIATPTEHLLLGMRKSQSRLSQESIEIVRKMVKKYPQWYNDKCKKRILKLGIILAQNKKEKSSPVSYSDNEESNDESSESAYNNETYAYEEASTIDLPLGSNIFDKSTLQKRTTNDDDDDDYDEDKRSPIKSLMATTDEPSSILLTPDFNLFEADMNLFEGDSLDKLAPQDKKQRTTEDLFSYA